MAWPQVGYDVMSRNHSNWFSPNSKGYAYNYWEPQALKKNFVGAGGIGKVDSLIQYIKRVIIWSFMLG